MLVSNAAGGMNPAFAISDLMVIEGHIILCLPDTRQKADIRKIIAGAGVAKPNRLDTGSVRSTTRILTNQTANQLVHVDGRVARVLLLSNQ